MRVVPYGALFAVQFEEDGAFMQNANRSVRTYKTAQAAWKSLDVFPKEQGWSFATLHFTAPGGTQPTWWVYSAEVYATPELAYAASMVAHAAHMETLRA